MRDYGKKLITTTRNIMKYNEIREQQGCIIF